MNAPGYAVLHAAYCQATGLSLPYVPMEMDSDYFLFSKRYDEADLRSVVAYLRHHYREKPDVLIATLRFRHLIRQLDRFSEYLAESRQWQARKASPKDTVLANAGRPAVKPEQPPQRASDVMNGLECLKKFKDGMGWK